MKESSNYKQRKMTCKKCGGKSFSFRWEYPADKEIAMFMAHPGVGFQLEDAIVSCATCGAESEYDEEDFLEVREWGDG